MIDLGDINIREYRIWSIHITFYKENRIGTDFMVMTKDGNLVILETKGDHLANDDSKQKLSLGRLWEAKAGSKYRYFMIFNNKDLKLDGVYILDEFMQIICKL